MSRGRLTKQELGWLLTQEAKGAAQRLRLGVQGLKGAAVVPSAEPVGAEVQLDATLDALDDAMRVLSTLHGPATGRGRRGRIDLAALLWEIAPDAHISIEPGSGTEVFGEESELRRMLQVLVGHESWAGASVTIKRDGDEVRVSAVLGPDSTSTSDTERALLSLMALRYGGRYELDGGAETLALPAEGVAERSEAEKLRKELDEAKKQGEAYARELAQLVDTDELAGGPARTSRSVHGDGLGSLLRLSRGIAGELRGVLAGAAHASSQKAGKSETDDDRGEGVRRALSRAQGVVGMLSSFGELDPAEPHGNVDIVDVVREAIRSVGGRAARGEVVLRVEAEGPLHVRAAPRATDVLVRQLVEHAIAASARGTEVVVRVVAAKSGCLVHVDDSGSTLPATARVPLIELEIEPGTYARPSAVPLFMAAEIAGWQNVGFELADAPAAGLRATLSFRGI